LRRHPEAASADVAVQLHAGVDAQSILCAAVPAAIPGTLAHRARRRCHGRSGRHSGSHLPKVGPRSGGHTQTAKLEWNGAERSISLGHDPPGHSGGQPGHRARALEGGTRGNTPARRTLSGCVRLPASSEGVLRLRRRMKRVIVTGATGFVGANLARRLLRDGHEVHLLVRPNYQPWRIEEIRSDVRLHELHLHDAEGVARVVSQIRPDWVFHLAVHGAYSWQTDWEQMVRTNIQGTMSLVSACLKTGFEAFVNTGSSSEYGFMNHAPAESEPVEPNSHYAITKVAATLFCRHTAQSLQIG